MTPTHFRKPRTGEQKLRVQWRNGEVSKHTYTVAQLVWEDRGLAFDIIAVERAA